ncbi:unnamed protein product, partial [Didymodactylos carnosus]
LIYSTTIISTIWILELHKIYEQKLKINVVTTQYYYVPWQKPREFLRNFKYLWSQIEIQVYLFLLLVIRWLLPKQQSVTYYGKSDLLFKYFTTAFDMLDFLDMLNYPELYSNVRLVYSALSVWSLSCLQFVIYVRNINDNKLKEFRSYLTNSLLEVLFLDIPFLCVRIYAIFGCGKHDYYSYFFTTKNILMIILLLIRIRAIFDEKRHHQKQQMNKLQSTSNFHVKPVKLSNDNKQQPSPPPQQQLTHYSNRYLIHNHNRTQDQSFSSQKKLIFSNQHLYSTQIIPKQNNSQDADTDV